MQNKGKFFLYRNAFQTENYENQTLDLRHVSQTGLHLQTIVVRMCDIVQQILYFCAKFTQYELARSHRFRSGGVVGKTCH